MPYGRVLNTFRAFQEPEEPLFHDGLKTEENCIRHKGVNSAVEE